MANLLTLVLVVLLVVLSFWYVMFRWSHRRILSTASRLPCPPTVPILGNALYFTGGISSKYINNSLIGILRSGIGHKTMVRRTTQFFQAY